MALKFMNYIMHVEDSVRQIHVVFDHYFQASIKSHTRAKRYGKSEGNVIHVIPDATIPKNWKLFLSRNENKSGLAKFYSEFMQQNVQSLLKEGQSLYLNGTVDENVIRVTKNSIIKSVRLLKSNHEEADTKMVLHAAYAADVGANNIAISSQDTDVLVLLNITVIKLMLQIYIS